MEGLGRLAGEWWRLWWRREGERSTGWARSRWWPRATATAKLREARPARGTPAKNWWDGEAQWDEWESVDMVVGGEEARVGRNQAEAEAAMEENGGLRRDGAILVTK